MSKGKALLVASLIGLLLGLSQSFSTNVFLGNGQQSQTTRLNVSPDNNEVDDDEATRLQKKAAELRKQVRAMEEQLGGERKRNYDIFPKKTTTATAVEPEATGKSLRRKRVLVVGANGRLGSMVCRHLLRNHPDTEVVAAVHYVGEQKSSTARGYGRLSYEVGAEDGIGRIGPAWSSSEERVATFEYDSEVMAEYNLRNLRVVEVELLDPVQCETITQDIDAVLWCATDFNDNAPRAISGLNVALLFRAIVDTTKGRVEIEGLQNILGGLKKNLQNRKWKSSLGVGGVAASISASEQQKGLSGPNDPTNVVLVSPAPGIFGNSETPFGEFNAMKRQGEQMLIQDFPSLTHTILQLGKFEENFVEEGLELLREEVSSYGLQVSNDKKAHQLRINRRDAARAVVETLTDVTLENKAVRVWTARRGG
jgi:hypothetical protein